MDDTMESRITRLIEAGYRIMFDYNDGLLELYRNEEPSIPNKLMRKFTSMEDLLDFTDAAIDRRERMQEHYRIYDVLKHRIINGIEIE